jgi:hypothetical protein
MTPRSADFADKTSVEAGSFRDPDKAFFEQAISEQFRIDRVEGVSSTRTLYEAQPRA